MVTENHPHWLGRLQAVGRAQARYLWVLLVAAIFYAALASQLGLDTGDALTVPFLDLDISAAIVLASAPFVLSFLVTAITGALRAYGRATDELGVARVGGAGEALDHHPNALDLAVYTTPETSKYLGAVLFFAYPAFLAVCLLEVLWIAVAVLTHDRSVTTIVMVALAAPAWLAGIVQVWGAVRWRWKQVRHGTHLRRPVSRAE